MDDNRKYIISLDNNIDINYLHLTSFGTSNTGTVPIWSVASRNDSNEFYEFELTAEEENETVPECDENSSTDQCHICDTAVPTQFLQKHYTSEKHRICAAIIRHALRRATKHSQSVPFTHTESANKFVPLTRMSRDETYYCDHCSLAVKFKNKEAHEKAKEHEISVIHDRLLNGLLITYLDRSKVVASSRYEKKDFHASDDSTKKDDDIVNKPVVDPDTDVGFCTDKGNKINKDEDEEWIIFKDDNVKYDNVANVEDCKNKGVSHNEQSTLEITKDFEEVTVSNFKVKVPINNYHGFVKKLSWAEADNYDCLVCDEVFVDTEMHKVEPRHIELISNQILDINCIRQINEVWHHCVLCNQKVQNKKHHISSELHQSKLHIILEESRKLKLQAKVDKTYYCDICNCYMHVTSKEEHMNTARHANLLKNNNNANNLHCHLKKLGDETLCIVCNIIVHDYNTDVHVKSKAHELAYKKLFIANKLTKYKKGFMCHACNSKQKNMFQIDHVQSDMHILNLSVYKPVPSLPVNTNLIENIDILDDAIAKILYLFESSNKIGCIKCRVCKIDFKSKARIKKHVTKQFHQFNMQALLDANKIKNLNGTYFCEVCHYTIDFTKEIDHINSGYHERNMSNEPLSWRKRDHIVSSVLLSATDNPASVYVSDDNTVDELFTRTRETDMKTSEHANESLKAEDSFKFKQIAHMNKSASTDTQKQNYISETDHANSKIYENKLTVCEHTSSVPVDLTSIEDIDFLDDATGQMLYLFESSNKIGYIKCRVCKIDFKSKARIKKHVTKQFHQFNMQALLDANKIKNLNGTYFCEVCHCTVDFTKEIDHITSGYHERNMSYEPLSWRERHHIVSSAPLSATDNTASVYVSDDNTLDELFTRTRETDMKTSEHANESLKAEDSFKFKQIAHMNKSASSDCQKQNYILETDHANSKIYENKLTICELTSSVPVDLTSIEDIDFLDDATAQMLYLFESSDRIGKVKCRVCMVDIKSKAAKIKGHMKKQFHQFHLQTLLDVNKIKKRNGTYFCEVCHSTVDFTKEIDHINSSDHGKNMSNDPLSWRERDPKVSSAPLSSTNNPASVYVLDYNTVEKFYMGSTEMDMKKSECDNESLKPRESFKFKQLMQMNKLRLIEDGEIFFCDLCLEHVASKSVIEHVQDQSHLDKLIGNTNEEDRNIPQYYCEACQTRVPDIYYIKDIHNRSKQHQLNLKCLMKANKQVDIEKNIGDAGASNFDYMLEPAEDRSSTKCKICQYTFKSNKTRHMESFMHITSLNLLCTKNKLKLQYTGKYLCELCNDNKVEVKEILNHINSEKHINNIAPIGMESKHDMATNSNSSTEKELITSNNDKQTNLNQPSKEKAKISNAENYVPVHKGNTQGFASATANNKSAEKHAAKSLKNKTESSGTYKINDSFDNDTVSLQGSSITMRADLKEVGYIHMNKYLEEVPSKESEVRCKLCDTVVPKTEVNIKDHLRGRRHNANYDKFVCSTVPSDINNKQKIVLNDSSCDNGKETNATEHAKAKSDTKGDTKSDNKNAVILQFPTLKFVDGILICRCCNTEVSSKQQDINTHLTDWRHEIKSSAYLAENGLTVRKNNFFCNICNIHISNLNVITHINSPSHKMTASVKSIEL